MLTITEFTAQQINDPFGILTGDRYEYIVDLEIPEDDELYLEDGVSARLLYLVEEGATKRLKYELINRKTEVALEFDLEEDELAMIDAFCIEDLTKQAE